ncbi:MAG: DUF1109 family protein [Acidobacteria bacterium]|nr:DUF1109 family protein [Acidobacteriota bacterium]
MRTEDLIVSLAGDARPVRLLEGPGVRFGRWSIAALVPALAALMLVGTRSDLAAAFSRASWAGEFGLIVMAGVLAGVAAQVSGVPGAAGTRAVRAGALVALAAWALAMVTRLGAAPAPIAALLAEPAHAACAARIAAIALVPGAMAWWQLRRAAALQPGWSAALAATASLASGAAAAQLMCPLDHAAHTITWHLLPVAALAAAAGLVGSRTRRLVASSSRGLVAL